MEVIDFSYLNVIVHCKMMRSSKGGSMEIIYTAFLIGTIAITLMFTLDSLS